VSRSGPCATVARVGVAAALCVATCDALADDPGDIGATPIETRAGERGRISLAFQDLHTGSLILDDGSIPGRTETDTVVGRVGIDWRLDARWELHASIPFIAKRSNGGPGAHRLDILLVPHPDAIFLDDGAFHAGWQDWSLGVSRHGAWRGFSVTSHATVVIPSHDYSFFGNAAFGQNLYKLELGVDLARRIGASNAHYGAGYSYVFVQEIQGVNMNENRWRLSAGYFFTPRVSARVFANGSVGKGRDSSDFPERRSEDWYHHDQTSRHDYAIAGVGAAFQIGRRYTLSASAATMVWGRTVHDLKHAYELQLSRSF
jgi:hypothetical protein